MNFLDPFLSGGLKGDKVVEHRATFVCLFICLFIHLFVPQASSGLESALSRLKYASSGPKSALSGLESALSRLDYALPGLESALPGLEAQILVSRHKS